MSLAANDRRIRKLSLKVSDSSHVYGTANRIEEAFRLVSLPGENEGRNYYFRYLNLGKIRRGENVTLLTLRLQKEFLRLMAQAVHAEDPRAPVSPAVYFQSSIEPLRYALQRIARGFPLDAWFFRSALPDLQLMPSPAEAVQRLLEVSAQHAGGQAHTAHLLAELLAHGELEALLPLVSEETAASFLSSFSHSHSAPLPVPKAWTKLIEEALSETGDAKRADFIAELLARGEFESVSSLLPPDTAAQLISAFSRIYSPPMLPNTWISLIQKALRLWGATDKRTLWIAVSALVSEAPARISDPDLRFKAQAIIARVAACISATPALSSSRGDGLSRSPATALGQRDPERPVGKKVARRSMSQLEEPAKTELQSIASSNSDASRTQPAPEQAPMDDAEPAPISPYAGFYFLLHVLRHLGIAEFVEGHPALLDVNFPWILLRALAAHVGIADDDPLLSCATEIPEHTSQHKFAVRIPAQWSEIFPKAQFQQPVEFTAHSLARLWVVAVHRWLRRFGELRIADVVRKRGAVNYARPQLDITLLLHGVDIRIRRLGLDVDPAWVAWLGLIVRFHYEHNLGDS
jgi:hypothetical protein